MTSAQLVALLLHMKLLLLILLVAITPLFSAETDPSLVLAGTQYCGVLPTGSMEPAINEHHWVMYKRLSFNNIRIGDVIIYTLPKPVTVGPYTAVTVCHRVVRKSSAGTILLTKGDANQEIDSFLITEDMYIGTVVAVVLRD